MADRSIVGWNTVAKYEIDSIASASSSEKQIRKAKNREISLRKNKKVNKPFIGVSSYRTSDDQFWTNSVNNGFTHSNQRNSNFRFRSNNFTKNDFFWSSQTPSSHFARSGDTCFGCGERGHRYKYCPSFRYTN